MAPEGTDAVAASGGVEYTPEQVFYAAACAFAERRGVEPDGYFEELTRSVFQGGLSRAVVDEKWPGFRRGFSNFSIRDVADYLPDDVDRLMSDPEIVRNLRKIEATIENAAEMLLIQIE